MFVRANTKLIDKVTGVCYEGPSTSWELEQDSEYAKTETDDAELTSETEF